VLRVLDLETEVDLGLLCGVENSEVLLGLFARREEVLLD